MFSAMHYITYADSLAEGDRAPVESAVREAAAAVTDVNLVATPHEGGSNCGDLVCKLGFASREVYDKAKESEGWARLRALLDDATKVSGYEFGAYDAGTCGLDNPRATNCVHRVLMFADHKRAKPEDVKRLDRLFSRFHEYVPLLNWRVSDVVESSGSRAWAHVWEQDLESLDIFTGPYMFTPFHPTYVDTFFDTECHNWTADPFLCTMTCDEESAFLGRLA